ncbi:AraC family transcriptional regulator [Shewanella schlegeliana]|uniref:Helix-turn-helix transcriptional regulator n=1 Tax=Shewanella schlegeliana TaxID=190308 RepID=A0ABS1T014_9GAMM|nr:AraC family transcriptional regulator [Shewanella schlegeliana]MBL4914113.1 helix-turn-helix transcriptional regulator [Shewanella schlegeliana]MCL1110850.1 AraC family transcriptional regulator [Shewanella schlegeliana]GIU36262.1 AraC family transcriptional regulator [Shewanella schlegeliana]
MDTLSALISHAEPKANLFFSGNLCGSSSSTDHPAGGILHLVKTGEMFLFEDPGLTHKINEPTLIIYPKGKAHRLQPQTLEGCDVVCANLSFKDSPLYRALPDAIVLPLSKLDSLSNIINMLFVEAFTSRFAQTAIISTLLDLLLLLVLRHLVENKICQEGVLSALSDPKLAKAIEIIHKQIDYPWTIEELASQVGMSRARFAALFNQTIGQPPLSYVTEARLLLAKKLLQKGEPIKSVSLEVGYSGSVAFSRAFQRQFGVTPRVWHKEHS